MNKLFMGFLLGVLYISSAGTAWAVPIHFEGTFSTPTTFSDGCYYGCENYIQISLDDYHASQYTIENFVLTGAISNPEPNRNWFGLQLSIKLPDMGPDEWQWLDQMSIDIGSAPVGGGTVTVTQPDWQPQRLNEALGEDGVLSMKLVGVNGGFTVDRLTLSVDATELSYPVPEPASLLLLGSGLIGWAGVRMRRII